MFKKVLYPVDVQQGALPHEATEALLENVRRWGAELYLVYVIPGFRSPMVASYFPADAEAKMREEAKTLLDRYVADHVPSGIGIHPIVREGTPYEEILAAAREHDVDLIVMPSHDRHGAERWLLGSTAEKVVAHAHRSVLMLRNYAPA